MVHYVVQRGDTLYLIAKRFGVSVLPLIDANPQLTNADTIAPGRVINVPIDMQIMLPSSSPSAGEAPPVDAKGCIVFASNRSGKLELWRSAPDGAIKEPLTDRRPAELVLADDPDAQWSPDGRYVAFLAKTDTGPALYILERCGDDPVKIADNAKLYSWSNNSGRIAYSNDEGTFTVTPEGTTAKVSDRLFNPVWSPDDLTLYGYTYADGLNYEILGSVGVDGQNFKAFTDPVIPADHVRVSPNGRFLAINTATGTPNNFIASVRVYDLQTKEMVTLPGHEVASGDGGTYDVNLLGDWSPDSSMLVYSSLTDISGCASIRIASPQGELLHSYDCGYYPNVQWGPDRDFILYHLSDKPGTNPLAPTKPRNLYIRNISTKQQWKITNTGDNYDPDWIVIP